MNLIELKERQNISNNIKLNKIYIHFGNILKELDKKGLPLNIIENINQDIEELNSSSLAHNDLSKLVKKKQTNILRVIEKELKIVTKNHYRNLWLALGMSVFGLPLGVAFGLMVGNLGLLALGLPFGMLIGIAVGSKMDKKALEENRQLNIECS
ncbi:hypothetical protein [Flavobacterium sp. K5-23]|uniref:hypothetical protein n=1 Tax=Flavobacterium sp. K5-23 TaxID=2746225 RepID=UPI00200CC514|nr:hypothetical protein [Flavobacterium sp. K5-23]UQD55520.1 hypothetical protein FLAK523_03560 [Flavobacterium sp. K5-23]